MSTYIKSRGCVEVFTVNTPHAAFLLLQLEVQTVIVWYETIWWEVFSVC